MHDQRIGRSPEIGNVGEVTHRIEADVPVHGGPEHMGRDAGYHEREAVRLRARNRLGADQPAATDPVLDVELPAEGGAQRVGIEPAERIGGTAGRKWHHDAHRLARPFLGCGAGNRQYDAGKGGEHAHHGRYRMSSSPCASATVIGAEMYLNSSACLSVTSRPFTSESCSACFGKNSSRVRCASARGTLAISA